MPYSTHFSENRSVPYLEFQFLFRSNLSLAPGGIEIVYQSSLQRLVDLSKLKKLLHVAHLCIILTSSSIDSLEKLQNLDSNFYTYRNDSSNISEDNCVHERTNKHNEHRKYFLHVSISTNVAKTDRG